MTADIVPFKRRRPGRPKPTTRFDRDQYGRAAARQHTDRLVATGRVVPARITLALDMRGLEGPEVDTACGTWEGNPDGDVDMWETAQAVPTAEQVQALATLTEYPLAWFYEPLPPGPLMPGPIRMCFSNGRTELVPPHVVDERGVLLYEGQPRELPEAQGRLF